MTETNKMSDTRIKILYIGGLGRSGSTLLDRMLGQIDGFCSMGELKLVWDRGFAENKHCSCGKPFRDCKFWRAVIKEAFGSFERVNLDEIKSLECSVNRIKNLPQLIYLKRMAYYKDRLEAFSQILSKLYKAIQKVSGCRVIVDSSKTPTYALLLNTTPELDLCPIHLVRDSRAVAFSYMRSKVWIPEITERVEYMQRYNPVISALRWNAYNVLCRWLLRKDRSYLLVNYERLVERTRDELKRIIHFAGESNSTRLDFIQGQQAYLTKSHCIAGNPMRFKNGWVNLCNDNEWREKMSPILRGIVTTLSFPGLLRYKCLQRNST